MVHEFAEWGVGELTVVCVQVQGLEDGGVYVVREGVEDPV